MINKVLALWLSVVIGICAPNHLFPQDSGTKKIPQVTAAGVTFATPAGWSVSSDQLTISALAPEGDAPLVILDEKAPDDATARVAWSVMLLDGSDATFGTRVAKERARLTFPTPEEQTSKLVTHYVNGELGNINVKRSGEQTAFVSDGGESRMATRKNDDGTISFINGDPPLSGFEFVSGEKDGKRALILRDGQHEYVFVEVS